jgi:hypothetical protein
VSSHPRMSGPSSTRQPCEFGKSLRNCWFLPSFFKHTSVDRTPMTAIFEIFPPAGTRTQKPSEESQPKARDATVKNSNKGYPLIMGVETFGRVNGMGGINLKAVIWFGHRLTAARKSIRECRNGGLQILAACLHHPRRDWIGKVRRFANAG